MSDSVSTIPAMLTALTAIGVSIWALWVQRIHNRKSVRPVGYIELYKGPEELRIFIVNKGCGPMEIKKLEVARGNNTEKNIVYHLNEEDVKTVNAYANTEPKGYWVLPGEKLDIFTFTGESGDKNFACARDNIRSVLEETTVYLTFGDVYEDQYPVYKKTLDWLKPDKS